MRANDISNQLFWFVCDKNHSKHSKHWWQRKQMNVNCHVVCYCILFSLIFVKVDICLRCFDWLWSQKKKQNNWYRTSFSCICLRVHWLFEMLHDSESETTKIIGTLYHVCLFFFIYSLMFIMCWMILMTKQTNIIGTVCHVWSICFMFPIFVQHFDWFWWQNNWKWWVLRIVFAHLFTFSFIFQCFERFRSQNKAKSLVPYINVHLFMFLLFFNVSIASDNANTKQKSYNFYSYYVFIIFQRFDCIWSQQSKTLII